MRAADRTKHWVEHENDDQRDFVFLFTLVGQSGKQTSPCFSVVRNCLDDGKTRTAMGTIGKGVVITSIVGIE